jgi:hypothetical protein
MMDLLEVLPGRPEEERVERSDRTKELNRRFMRRLKMVFSDAPEVVQQLKEHARALIEERIDASEFYNIFGELCGPHKNAIFTDMVAIMPDRVKRAELLRLHENVAVGRKVTGAPVAACQPRTRKKPKAIRLIEF